MSWDLVFCQPDGRPVGHKRDHADWKSLLADAGVRDARLHDARHTAASLLLLLKVPPRLVMEVLGHSSYQLTMNTSRATSHRRSTTRRRSSWPERCGTARVRRRPRRSASNHRE